ncbi:MAG TPA: FAD-dependent oxidoreductase [Chloroflexota bacterium]|nr:FAD-dependent oxidoreductase [Chloroflexota bacterium]
MESSAARRFVIIGNGITGTTAADTIRKGDPNASVTLLASEPYSLYNRIALPPFLKQKVPRAKVTIKTIEWHQERGLDLRLETTAVRVDPSAQEVYLADGAVLPYDTLLVSTGGRANPLPWPNRLEGIFNFQTLDDSLAIMERIECSRDAVVIGGSYISYELAEAFRSRGLQTTWMMRGPWFLRRVLEEEGGMLVDRIAAHHGVEMIHGVEIAEVHGDNGTLTEVLTTDGRTFPADILGVGLGITRNVDFLDGSGIPTKNAVITDEFLRTTIPNVFAGGDSAEYYDPYVGHHSVMGTWDNATNHGKIAGANMLGDSLPYNEVPTYSTTLFHSKIMAFGATPESNVGLEAVMAIDDATESYRRLFFQDELLLGGVIIGGRKGYPRLIELVQTQTPIPRSEREALVALQ